MTILLVKHTPTALEIGCRDLTNRVWYDLTWDDWQAPPPPLMSPQDFQWMDRALRSEGSVMLLPSYRPKALLRNPARRV